MKIVKDDTVTTSYGFYECPECKATFYAGGEALHRSSCSLRGRTWQEGYEHCIYHVGPNFPEYDEAE